MRILLDECVPRRLKHSFSGHIVTTVPEAGWAGIKNGALLLLAAEEFDIFVTVDWGIQYQQNLAAFDILIVLLKAPTNDISDLEVLIPRAIEAFGRPERGKPIIVGG